MNLKKSGKSKYVTKKGMKVEYDYYELQDFLPHAMKLFQDYKLFSKVNYFPDMANLVIINSEKPDETIEFTSTIVEAQLALGTKIQELGAMQTYLRRYLYVIALEIIEADAIDPQNPEDLKPEDDLTITQTEANKFFELIKELNLDNDILRKILDNNGYKGQGSTKVKKKDYSKILAKIKEAAK